MLPGQSGVYYIIEVVNCMVQRCALTIVNCSNQKKEKKVTFHFTDHPNLVKIVTKALAYTLAQGVISVPRGKMYSRGHKHARGAYGAALFAATLGD